MGFHAGTCLDVHDVRASPCARASCLGLGVLRCRVSEYRVLVVFGLGLIGLWQHAKVKELCKVSVSL